MPRRVLKVRFDLGFRQPLFLFMTWKAFSHCLLWTSVMTPLNSNGTAVLLVFGSKSKSFWVFPYSYSSQSSCLLIWLINSHEPWSLPSLSHCSHSRSCKNTPCSPPHSHLNHLHPLSSWIVLKQTVLLMFWPQKPFTGSCMYTHLHTHVSPIGRWMNPSFIPIFGVFHIDY